MKKKGSYILILFLFIFLAAGYAKFDKSVIDKVRIIKQDIPAGFTFGKVPGFARNVLKDNPWLMDKKAIRKLMDRIYPGGDFSKVKDIHMTILANNKNPFGDDIVCYVILYHDSYIAKDEIKKVTDYVGYNRDRAIALYKDNMVVFLHVDSQRDYHHILEMSQNIEGRFKKI